MCAKIVHVESIEVVMATRNYNTYQEIHVNSEKKTAWF